MKFTDLLAERVRNAAAAVGTEADLARWLDVSRSQTNRWAKGETAPSADARQAITDLDFIVARARMVWVDDVVPDWLRGRSAFLGGATSLDMIRSGHTTEVLEAISAEGAGVYA